jgi:transposase-like protein
MNKYENCPICADTLVTKIQVSEFGLFWCPDCKKYYLICYRNKPNISIVMKMKKSIIYLG